MCPIIHNPKIVSSEQVRVDEFGIASSVKSWLILIKDTMPHVWEFISKFGTLNPEVPFGLAGSGKFGNMTWSNGKKLPLKTFGKTRFIQTTYKRCF